MIDDSVFLCDLDGTGSLHVCAKGDPGAIEFAPLAEVERWHDAYTMAFDQAMSNGQAASTARAHIEAQEAENARLREALGKATHELEAFHCCIHDDQTRAEIGAIIMECRAALSPVLIEDGK